MDYEINLASLGTKKSELENMTSKIDNIKTEYDSSYIKQSSSTEISSLITKTTDSIDRLQKAYKNTKSWLDRYVNEFTQLENNLSSFSSSNLKSPKVFQGEFMDIFSKVTIPKLKSDYLSSEELLKTLTYGSFTEQRFVASNGAVIDYYIYLPKYETEVDNLPVMIYMHGGSAHGNGKSGLLSHGLSKAVATKQVTPSGIVIIPYIRNFEGDNIQVGIRELADNVVSTYNADPNRISISGHSYGAITAYRAVNANPGYFSAVVPISGWDKVTEAFNGVKVWAFHGSEDNRGGGSHTTYPGALNAVSQINAIGGTALMHTFQGAGHGWVQDYTYEQTYESPDGKEESVLEWAFRQDKTKI